MSENLDHPIYFLTWTTYGTWLSGDERGWVNADAAGPVEPIREENVRLEAAMQERLLGEPVRLDNSQRRLVHDTIESVCVHRGWTLFAVNCRTNHVHVVLLASERSPEVVMNSLKSWCSRRLNEALGKKRDTAWWTRHGSTKWLNTTEALNSAVEYVLNGQ